MRAGKKEPSKLTSKRHETKSIVKGGVTPVSFPECVDANIQEKEGTEIIQTSGTKTKKRGKRKRVCPLADSRSERNTVVRGREASRLDWKKA